MIQPYSIRNQWPDLTVIGDDLNTQAMGDALNAIHDVAFSALSDDMSTQTGEKIQLILSIARHKTDVRTTDERQTKDTK